MTAGKLEPGQLPVLAAEMGVALTVAQTSLLLRYVELIQKWNKVYNLTALRDPGEMFTHHLLDSLAAVAPLQRHLASSGKASARLLDVGSGAGLPGVVFAICCPELAVSCVDTVGKKAAFIQQAAAELGLRNLRGVHARVESLKEPFDVVSSRAGGAVGGFTAWCAGAHGSDGIWLSMKAKTPTEEIAALPSSVEVFHVEQLTVPGLDAERCIVWLRAAAV
jgi:16S rRNA (guanine527-N7)-methyltransferase